MNEKDKIAAYKSREWPLPSKVREGVARRGEKATLSVSSGGDWCELLLQSALFRKNSSDQPFVLESVQRTRKKEMVQRSGILSLDGSPGPVA